MTAPADKPHLSREHMLALLKQMIRIRRFEEKCVELYTQEKIRGFLHVYDGEEAIAVGVIPVLEKRDRIVATYREHAHALVRGVPINTVMAEMYGKQEGCSRGRGGSMHLFDRATNFHGGNAIVGGGLPLAVGLALADHMQDNNLVIACFFGEGAVAEGEFHESLNLAALWGLPVLFVCENNLYAMGTALAISESEMEIQRKAACYRIASEAVDGMDVVAVEAAARRAVHAVRENHKPYFLECRTYRLRPHSMFDPQLYRDKSEVEAWRHKEPIVRFQGWLQTNHMVHQDDVSRIEAEIDAEIAQAVAFAEAGTWEPIEQLTRFTYADRAAPTGQ
jgi:pyruvate dehydrogenase E1 component alpha subunit